MQKIKLTMYINNTIFKKHFYYNIFCFNNVKIIILKYQDLFKRFKKYITKYLNNNFFIYSNMTIELNTNLLLA